ncbi:MAG: hypothetical protein AAFP99_05550, partial [Pseudomonadota bacterium]
MHIAAEQTSPKANDAPYPFTRTDVWPTAGYGIVAVLAVMTFAFGSLSFKATGAGVAIAYLTAIMVITGMIGPMRAGENVAAMRSLARTLSAVGFAGAIIVVTQLFASSMAIAIAVPLAAISSGMLLIFTSVIGATIVSILTDQRGAVAVAVSD